MPDFSQALINLGDRFVVLGEEVIPITNMLDGDGDETEEPDDAVVVVAGPDAAGQWFTLEVGADWVPLN